MQQLDLVTFSDQVLTSWSAGKFIFACVDKYKDIEIHSLKKKFAITLIGTATTVEQFFFLSFSDSCFYLQIRISCSRYAFKKKKYIYILQR